MSVYVKYDPDLFALDLQSGDDWLPIEAASVSVTKAYTVSDNADRTLLLDSDTAQINLSWWRDYGAASGSGEPEVMPLIITDVVRISYDGKTILLGTVESSAVQFTSDANAAGTGYQRLDFSVSVMGTYLVPLSTTVSWASLPSEGAKTRIQRWFAVTGTSPNITMPAQGAGSATLLDLLRLFSVTDGVSVQLTDSYSVQIVSFAALPTGFDSFDARDMYWQTKRSAQAGHTELSLDAGDLLLSASASLVTDDVRLLVSDWELPEILPLFGQSILVAPVQRVSYTFTPQTFQGSVEFHLPPESLP